MAELDLHQKTSALQPQPRLTGKVISESADSLTVQAGGCLAEIPSRHIAQRTAQGQEVELVLTKDAEILVSTLVSAKKGLVASDAFGALVPGVLADNCNCNCNCREVCNCNCNCNCTCSVEALADNAGGALRPFLKPFSGGAKS